MNVNTLYPKCFKTQHVLDFRFVIKLCETIFVKEIETGSFEYYSSQPRDISVDVSDRYT